MHSITLLYSRGEQLISVDIGELIAHKIWSFLTPTRCTTSNECFTLLLLYRMSISVRSSKLGVAMTTSPSWTQPCEWLWKKPQWYPPHCRLEASLPNLLWLRRRVKWVSHSCIFLAVWLRILPDTCQYQAIIWGLSCGNIISVPYTLAFHNLLNRF